MLKARENKASITKFVHSNPEVQYLIPTDEEWKTCEIIECVLELFYDYTYLVSKAQPCLPNTISIM